MTMPPTPTVIALNESNRYLSNISHDIEITLPGYFEKYFEKNNDNMRKLFEQNDKIIELLQKLVEKKVTSSETNSTLLPSTTNHLYHVFEK